MKLDTILVKITSARKEGSAYLIPADVEATLFVGLPGETMSIVRINRIEISEGVVQAQTAKGESFAVLADDVRAIKVDRMDPNRRDRGAGFGKVLPSQ